MDLKKPNPCVLCDHARMRRDICGTYCTGGFEKPDGTCDHFKDYFEAKKERRAKRRYPHE